MEKIYLFNENFEVRIPPGGEPEYTTYYRTNEQLLARKDTNNNMHYYLNDHLGSTHVVVDQAGAIEERTLYYPFGGIRTGGKAKFTFTGQESDKESNLLYYGARYYKPELRRFLQPDPVIQNPYDPQTLNHYSYVRNNPLKFIDDSGNALHLPALAIPGIIGGAAGFGYYALFGPGDKWDWRMAAKYTVYGAVAGYVATGLGGAVAAMTEGTALGELTIAGTPLWQYVSQATSNFAYSLTFSAEENIELGNGQVISAKDVSGAIGAAIGGTLAAKGLRVVDIRLNSMKLTNIKMIKKSSKEIVKLLTVQATATGVESWVEGGKEVQRTLKHTGTYNVVINENGQIISVELVEDRNEKWTQKS